MDVLVRLSDRAIRRLCAPPGLGLLLVMISLAATPALALQIGGHGAGLIGLALLLAAWRLPRQDVRGSALWNRLGAEAEGLVRRVSGAALHAKLAEALHQRLLWHAERVAALAVALWAASMLGGMASLSRP